MVSLPQISKGLITFIEQDLIVHGTSKQKFAMYFIMPQIPQKIEGLFNQYKDSIILKDYITEGGIDLEGLYRSSKQAINKSGNIELFGIILNEQDLDNLYTYISKAIV